MYQTEFSLYLGRETEEEFIGYSSENNFFGIIKVRGEFSKEKGRELVRQLSSQASYQNLQHLREFEAFLATYWRKENLPDSFTSAFGFFHNGLLWLKTSGKGKIYLLRKGKLACLIKGDTSASGYVEEGDLFVFTAEELSASIESEERLASLIRGKTPPEIVETITPILKEKDDQGVVALFTRWISKIDEEELVYSSSTQPVIEGERDRKISPLLQNIKNTVSQIRSQLYTQDKKKTLTFIGVGVIILIFFWSVVLGYQRRVSSAQEKKLETAKETITEKLRQAEDVAFLNLPRATALINETKDILANTKKDIPDKNNNEIRSLEKLIGDAEGKILKKEEKQAEEYFDFSLEDKNALAQKLYLETDNLVAINPKGTAYVFSLTKKSIDKRSAPDIKETNLIVYDGENVYTYRKSSGIFQITSDGKSKKIIENDPDWKDVVDIVSYNKNLYVLDRGANDIYKYAVAESGFGAKTSYLKGDKPKLQSANSLAIDASVYIGTDARILKFISGVQDTFATSFPQPSINITKVITNKDLEKVYAWDKQNGAIYVIGKSGDYEREVNSSIFSKASDVVVFQNNAYAASGAKLYKVSLE